MCAARRPASGSRRLDLVLIHLVWDTKLSADVLPLQGKGYNFSADTPPAAFYLYTQLLWRSSLRVGCGYTRCSATPASHMLLCYYDPPGNWAGAFPGYVQPAGKFSPPPPRAPPRCPPPPSRAPTDGDMRSVLEVTNYLRALHGAGAMAWDAGLASAAVSWAGKLGLDPKNTKYGESSAVFDWWDPVDFVSEWYASVSGDSDCWLARRAARDYSGLPAAGMPHAAMRRQRHVPRLLEDAPGGPVMSWAAAGQQLAPLLCASLVPGPANLWPPPPRRVPHC